MVSVLASSAVDRGFEPWSSQTNDYKIGNPLRTNIEQLFFSETIVLFKSKIGWQIPWMVLYAKCMSLC
jgi:hypothetical protein